jgi:hypothetical protein
MALLVEVVVFLVAAMVGVGGWTDFLNITSVSLNI